MLETRNRHWFQTSTGEPRGYVQPHALEELWFHTGTACNLECPFCLEGSRPGDNRLGRITLVDAQPFIDEAVGMGVGQFSFTGGEPFIVKGFVDILRYAANRRPCLVLTNGTDPVHKRLDQVRTLGDCTHPVSFRISLDYADERLHDDGRGIGSFAQSLRALQELNRMGFGLSVARQSDPGEDTDRVDAAFRALMRDNDLPDTLKIVSFPDFDVPGARRDVPDITEDCMTRHHTEESRRRFMCAFSKMVVKINGMMRVYACTLVDDDPAYDLGGTLGESMDARIMLHHHRCFSCFRYGASCSEL